MQQELTIREYNRKDFEGYLACISGFYGTQGYPYKEYLDANTLDEKILSGDLILTVAVTDDQKVVATVAAEMQHGDFEGAVVLKLRNVLNEYRGIGISSRQLDDLLKRLHCRFPDAISIYADVMTHNVISQNSLIHRGYEMCGLRLMVYKNSCMIPQLSFPPHTKMTQAIYSRRIGEKDITLYLPKEHREFVSEIYDRLGTTVTCSDETCPSDGTCVFRTEQSPLYAKSEIIVQRGGTDLLSRLGEYIDRYRSQEDYTFVAYIPMSERDFCDIYDAFRFYGFYFSGILPLTRNAEYMIMAKTDGCSEDFDQIALSDALGNTKDKFIAHILNSKKEGINICKKPREEAYPQN